MLQDYLDNMIFILLNDAMNRVQIIRSLCLRKHIDVDIRHQVKIFLFEALVNCLE